MPTVMLQSFLEPYTDTGTESESQSSTVNVGTIEPPALAERYLVPRCHCPLIPAPAPKLKSSVKRYE